MDPSTRGDDGTAGDPGAADDPCNITEVTTLNSPVDAVISTLATGATLDVELQDGPPRRLLAKTRAGAIAGTITSAKSSLIIQCMKQGRAFKAIVQEVRGGLCVVEIQPR